MSCLQRLRELAQQLLDTHQVKSTFIKAAGISCGGPLNSSAGIILSPPNLPGWDEVPVVDLLKSTFPFPVHLQNDANAGALAEWKWGAAAGTQTAVFLTFGTGLGAGLIINGRLHAGNNDLAGEVGHWRLASNGPIGFGKRGSLEGFCSGAGIQQLAAPHFKNLDIKTLAEKARSGDMQAREIFELSGEKLGAGLALIIDLLNPEIIVLGSIFVRCEDLLRPPMEKILRRETLTTALQNCRIIPAQLNEQIGDYAALAVAMGID
jgi:glucokinase